MSNDFFEALELLTAEKGIPPEKMIEHIKNAISVAVRKYYGVGEENVCVDINRGDHKFKVSIVKDIVEEVEDSSSQVSIEEALDKNKRSKVGGKLTTKLDTRQIGRIAAQSGKNLIHQAINEVVKEQLYERYQSKIQEVVTATVQKIEPQTGNVTLELDKNEVMLFKSDQIPGEVLTEGQKLKVYVSDILASERRTSIKVSRTHRDMVRRLFEQAVPEIFDGTVEIKAVSREAGSRTKMAVCSNNPEVDPRGACIGQGGTRVAHIVEELQGEKIDVVLYHEDPEEFIAGALSPADVVKVDVTDPVNRICRVTVPDHQLSLAIGNKGQNAKLAAKLTGYKIDIKPESGFYGEEREQQVTQTVSSQDPIEAETQAEATEAFDPA